MTDLLDFGKYSVFIWGSYGASLLVIGALMIRILARRKQARAQLRDMEARLKESETS
jgi:heme exporter protein CcmD